MTIRTLFDSGKDIYRSIEKVITYGASQEERLKAEISEYVVTESIEDQIEDLLDRLGAAEHLTEATLLLDRERRVSFAQIAEVNSNPSPRIRRNS